VPRRRSRTVLISSTNPPRFRPNSQRPSRLSGTASPTFYVSPGTYSRCTDVTDLHHDATGCRDDCSGVAIVLELARLFATTSSPATSSRTSTGVQGLFGPSTFMATRMAGDGTDVPGIFTTTIVVHRIP